MLFLFYFSLSLGTENKYRMEEGEHYAIETFGSTGRGKVTLQFAQFISFQFKSLSSLFSLFLFFLSPL